LRRASAFAPADLDAYGFALNVRLTLRAVALLFLPLQKFAEERLTLLLRKIRGRGTFIFQEGGKIAAS
jgi:hypothetical protein